MQRRFQTGDRIGDYRIDGFLGAGGMGEVYLGFHTKLHRRAAIKVLKTTAIDANFTKRFFNEARVHSSLHHPSIATLYDFQEIDRQLYIFMEYVDGESLDDLIKRRRFAVEDAVRAFESICQAIAFIHRNGIVHRDIKPQNIKFTSAGALKLLDFGIAKDSSSKVLTQIGGVVGTPSYLAPEQLDGKPASPQTDIWSLGVLFYEMLTGVEPFKSDSFVTLAMMITLQNFQPPEKINPAIPPEISGIVEKCLQKNTAQRYRAVDDLLADLRKFLSGEKPAAAGGGFGLKNLHGFFSSNTPLAAPDFSSGDSPGDKAFAPENSAKLPIAGIAVGSALAVLFLFGLVGIGIWAMSGSSAPGNANHNLSTPKPNVAAPSGNIKSSSSAQGSSQPASKKERVVVRVEVIEGAAQMFRDGQFIGTTPFELEGIDGETINITLKREGYESKNVAIEMSPRERVLVFLLKRKQ